MEVICIGTTEVFGEWEFLCSAHGSDVTHFLHTKTLYTLNRGPLLCPGNLLNIFSNIAIIFLLPLISKYFEWYKMSAIKLQ